MRWTLAASLAAVVTLGWARAPYREGPPPGHTGGFGEPTCAECHFGGPLNDDAGAATLDAPAAFEPGQSYELRLSVEHPELAAAGFQLAVRFAEGDRAGEQAGRLEPMDARTNVTSADTGGPLYAHHTSDGTDPVGDGQGRWVLRWTAPDTAAAVLIHAAANAANDDASEFGDFIFTASLRLHPAS